MQKSTPAEPERSGSPKLPVVQTLDTPSVIVHGILLNAYAAAAVF